MPGGRAWPRNTDTDVAGGVVTPAAPLGDVGDGGLDGGNPAPSPASSFPAVAPDAPAPEAGDPRVRAADEEPRSNGYILPDTLNNEKAVVPPSAAPGPGAKREKAAPVYIIGKLR